MAEGADDPNGAARPDPAAARTPAEFVDAMRRLLRWSGLSYREVAKRASDAGESLPRSTLTAALARDSLPRESIVVALVRACGGDEQEIQRWSATLRRIASAPHPDTSDLPASAAAGARAGRRAGLPLGVAAAVALSLVTVTVLAVLVGRALLAPSGEQVGNAAPDRSVDVRSTKPQGTPLGRAQPCPDGWFCLYEHSDFNRDQAGRMLKFQDDYWQPLAEWDFDDHASAARNLLGRDACLSATWPVGASKLRVPPGAELATLDDWDNQASGIKLGPCQ